MKFVITTTPLKLMSLRWKRIWRYEFAYARGKNIAKGLIDLFYTGRTGEWAWSWAIHNTSFDATGHSHTRERALSVARAYVALAQ